MNRAERPGLNPGANTEQYRMGYEPDGTSDRLRQPCE